MSQIPVVTGAIALIRVGGTIIGKMKNVRAQEQMSRIAVRGIGTIIPSEQAVVSWEGTLTCSFMSIDLRIDGIPGALKRLFPNIISQVSNGNSSFEDQLVLDTVGIQVDIFKKVSDVVDQNGIIKPKLIPYASIGGCLIESDSFDISEGQIAGRDQTFKYLVPITFLQ